MKLAIVYDDLIQFGGGERLLLDVHKIWPDAPIYTTVASRKWKQLCKEEKIDLRISFLQYLPFVSKLNRYYAPFLFHVLAFENLDLSDYDVVLSVSNRFSHGIITKPNTMHVCYMNSPGRMFWEPLDYFENENFGLFKSFSRVLPKILNLSLSHLKIWDYTAAQRVDYFIANSKTPQYRINKYFSRGSVIIHPSINVSEYKVKKITVGNYYLVISRLVAWKKIDIAIDACNELGVPLVIIGTGSDMGRLMKKANSNIEFLGFVSEGKKKEILGGCRAVIHPQYEDFGIVPLESMASGKPVVAYGKGGALETVVPGKTGEFFFEQSSGALKAVLKDFDSSRFSPYDCEDRAKKFDNLAFTRKLKRYVNAVYLEGKKSI